MRKLLAVSMFIAAGQLAAAPMAGLSGNSLVFFDSSDPATIVATVPFTVPNAETVIGIASRPASGVLYGITSGGRVVTLALNGTVTVLSAATQALGSNDIGVGFNPAVDRIRVVTAAGGNMRFNPNDGLLVGTDTALNGSITGGVSVAYDRPTNPAPLATTMFVIDSASDTLNRQGGVDGTPSPNTGSNTAIGALGVDTSAEVGFDISATGETVASLNVAGASGLYTVNLGTGAATLRGNFPVGTVVNDVAFVAGFPPVANQLPTLNGFGLFAALAGMILIGFGASRRFS